MCNMFLVFIFLLSILYLISARPRAQTEHNKIHLNSKERENDITAPKCITNGFCTMYNDHILFLSLSLTSVSVALVSFRQFSREKCKVCSPSFSSILPHGIFSMVLYFSSAMTLYCVFRSLQMVLKSVFIGGFLASDDFVVANALLCFGALCVSRATNRNNVIRIRNNRTDNSINWFSQMNFST